MTDLPLHSDLSRLCVEAAIDPNPSIVSPETPLVEAIARMSFPCSLSDSGQIPEQTRNSCAIVMQGEQLVGLLTERDVVRAIAQRLDLEQVSIAEVMSRHPITLARSQCRDIFYLVDLFRHYQIRHLPILNDDGGSIGMVSTDTVCRALLSADLLQWQRVAEVMTRDVIKATPSTSVRHLAQIMAEYRVSCVVICQSKRSKSMPLGIVTERDIVQFYSLGLDFQHTQASTVMSSPLFSVRSSDSLWEVHQQMQRHRVQRLVVLEAADHLSGIVTQTSLLRSLTSIELYRTLQGLHQQILDLQTEKQELQIRGDLNWQQSAAKIREIEQKLHKEQEARVQAEIDCQIYAELARTTFERVAVGMFHAQPDGTLLRVNPQFCNLLGYTEAELQGQSLYKIAIAEDDSSDPDWLESLMGGKQRVMSIEQRYLHKEGVQIWVNLTLSAVHSTTGGADYVIGVVEDISDRKYGEALLQDSEERFRAIFEQAAVGMEICMLDGRFFRLNEKFCDIVGFSRHELLARTDLDLTHPDDRAANREKLEQLVAGVIPHYSIEKRYVRKDGSIVWVSAMISIMCNANQEPKYFIGVVEDISVRKQVEVDLRASEEQFRAMFENHQSMMLLIDPESGEIIDANHSAEQFYNLTPEALNQLTIFDLNQVPKYQVAQDMIKAKLEVQNAFVFPHERQNGEVRWVEVYSSPIEYHGKQLLFSILHDITDRKQAEEALKESQHFVQQIADSTPNILYLYDLIKQRHVYVNHEITTILGYTSEEFQSMNYAALDLLIHVEDRENFNKYIHQFYTAKLENIFELEYRMQHANGQWLWLYRRDTLFNRTEEGKPQQILGTATDITERKEMEDQLQQTNQQLQSSVNQLELRNNEMKLLRQMSDLLHACLTVEEAYEAMADLIKPLFPDCSGAVFISNVSSNLMEAVSTWGEHLQSESLFPHQDCWSLRRGLLHDAEQTRPSLFCKHVHRDPLPAESLCVPIIAQGETMGLLYLDSPKIGRLSEEWHHLARTAAERLSLALANLKLRETLHNQSIRDPLTGLFNRRYMEESLQREIHRAERGRYSLGIVMIDVDHFKRFNDTWGHEAGDTVLRELSNFLQRNIRSSDIACRYGGEELTLIFPEISLEETKKRAEQLRQGVRQLNLFSQAQSLGTMTISLGVASFPEHGKTSDALIQLADAALYRAKAEGRDCVVCP
jgi:diguanylate cyclase (GGDEF)-like protein/PAS domain S-box-containing protein